MQPVDGTGTASFGWRTTPADMFGDEPVSRRVAPPHRIVLLLPTDAKRTRVNPARQLARVAAMGMALPAGLFDGPAQCRVATPDGRAADSLLGGLKAAADSESRSLIVYVTGNLALGGDQQLYLVAPGLPLRLTHLLGVRWEWITHAIGRAVGPTRLLMVDLEAESTAWSLLTDSTPSGVDRLVADGTSLWGQVRPIGSGRRKRDESAARSWTESVAALLRDGLPGGPAVLTPEALHEYVPPGPRKDTLTLARFTPSSGSVQLLNRAVGRGVLSMDALPGALQDALRRQEGGR